MRAMGLALLITLVAFAGCLDGGDGDDSTPTDTATGSATPTETATETQTETDTGTSDPEPEENTPPTASLSASIQQGEVPVNVTFTLDGADADGDALNWTFDADGDGIFEAEGNGTGLPATYNHSYAANGTYNATLTVSDGKDSATQTVTINATAAAGGEGPVQAHEGGWAFTNPAYCGIIGEVEEPLNGVFTEGIDVDAATYGLDFVATFSSEVEDGILEYQVGFVNAAFDILETYAAEPGTDVQGSVPADATRVYFSACGVSGEVSVSYAAG